MSEIPMTLEATIEGARRASAGLDDYRLDIEIATACAKRDVAVAHGYDQVATLWAEVLIALDDVRRGRMQVRREIEEMTGPRIMMRPLTAEELAESEWDDDEPMEPPC